MPLPIIDQPLFHATLPSSKTEIKFRPFTVKEEKILLIAQESKEISQIVEAVKQVVQNCIVGDTDVGELATFDIEYMLLQLRAKSVDNVVEFRLVDDETEESVDVEMNLDQVEVIYNPDHSDIIQLTPEISMKMRYPTFDELNILLTGEGSDVETYQIMINCIDVVIQGDSIHKMKDYSKQEVDTFVESMNKTQLAEIKKFFDTMPVLRHEVKYKNNKGHDRTFVVQGLEAFFI